MTNQIKNKLIENKYSLNVDSALSQNCDNNGLKMSFRSLSTLVFGVNVENTSIFCF